MLVAASDLATSLNAVVAAIATVTAAFVGARAVHTKTESTTNVDLLIALVDKKDEQLAKKDARIDELEAQLAAAKRGTT